MKRLPLLSTRHASASAAQCGQWASRSTYTQTQCCADCARPPATQPTTCLEASMHIHSRALGSGGHARTTPPARLLSRHVQVVRSSTFPLPTTSASSSSGAGTRSLPDTQQPTRLPISPSATWHRGPNTTTSGIRRKSTATLHLVRQCCPLYGSRGWRRRLMLFNLHHIFFADVDRLASHIGITNRHRKYRTTRGTPSSCGLCMCRNEPVSLIPTPCVRTKDRVSSL